MGRSSNTLENAIRKKHKRKRTNHQEDGRTSKLKATESLQSSRTSAALLPYIIHECIYNSSDTSPFSFRPDSTLRPGDAVFGPLHHDDHVRKQKDRRTSKSKKTERLQGSRTSHREDGRTSEANRAQRKRHGKAEAKADANEGLRGGDEDKKTRHKITKAKSIKAGTSWEFINPGGVMTQLPSLMATESSAVFVVETQATASIQRAASKQISQNKLDNWHMLWGIPKEQWEDKGHQGGFLTCRGATHKRLFCSQQATRT